YPTLARIALDVLPAQATSVPCEAAFSGGERTANKRRMRLGRKLFEELQVCKFNLRQAL
ncbi:hypothetical protein BOTBODRAFT_82444, partial [Botryobasidium botryosum FD-172 SS1]